MRTHGTGRWLTTEPPTVVTVGQRCRRGPPANVPEPCESRGPRMGDHGSRTEVAPAYPVRRGGPGRSGQESQTACSPRKYSKTQPTVAMAPKTTPITTSHQPTARPRKTSAADAASGSGHQLCGLKKP